MKRILELGLLWMLSTVPLFGAKNSQVFLLLADVRVGNVQLPKGHCSVTWSKTSGSEVQLTFKTEDKKTITISAREVEGKPNYMGVVTFVDNGITYLEELDTANARFIVQNPPNGQK
jgi:phenolic acid decarboxylase